MGDEIVLKNLTVNMSVNFNENASNKLLKVIENMINMQEILNEQKELIKSIFDEDLVVVKDEVDVEKNG